MTTEQKHILMKQFFDLWRGMIEYDGDEVRGWVVTSDPI